MNDVRLTGTECEWKETNNGEVWATECGNSFFFDTYGPTENGFVYCPFCGNVIVTDEPKRQE